MQPLIVLTGPTAAGKTALSLRLAQKIGGEIISADSMQVYRKMDIGTAKITTAEMKGIKHHMLDILDPADEFNVVIFQKMAKECICEISARGRIPIIVGGTGFYIQALLYDINFELENNGSSSNYRKELNETAILNGPEYLHDLLKKVDEEAANAIHPNNKKRLIRALEYYHQNKKPISLHNETEKKRQSPYNFAYFVLNDDREKIYENINQRVDKMLKDGLIDEVMTLKNNGFTPAMVSMQGLGYKEIFAYLDGKISFEEATTLLKRDTRRFAKRQLTWFRRERDVVWLDKGDFAGEEAMVEEMVRVIKDKRIIR
ncbi:MAG: tRNA (adenosine(37)-N6)-dimethylallyltransferase MiaA [Lachnospiraceae bacterium]|nr:tRNA (adenosine(37)-N6)-dimethylallyltransferase MiaA [Lachnospiraceae bacterium]